jgi:hypothetical protein
MWKSLRAWGSERKAQHLRVVIPQQSFEHWHRRSKQKFFYVPSLLHLGVIFACLPDFYLFKRGGFKATASRRHSLIFKQARYVLPSNL